MMRIHLELHDAMSDFLLRHLTGDDAEAFREFRFEGLKLYPTAFGSDYQYESIQSLAFFRTRIENNATFGAFLSDGALVNVAGLIVQSGAKVKHKGLLVGTYAQPRVRGTGLAKALLDHVLAYARTVVEEVTLKVACDNPSAIRLYQQAGFQVYGREPRELKIDGVYHDSLCMRLCFA
ncbi:acetyltransferase, GNAT family [Candidatus Burkholderia humilis]|nr:acetyltransferase, GNAT family [Candidatus Burkholderia humilis]